MFESDDSQWLVFLLKLDTFAVFSLSLDKLIPCKIEGLLGADETIKEVVFHPDFYMSQNNFALVTVELSGG